MAEYKEEVYDTSCPVKIMVMGVGGGGNNAVDRMVAEDIRNVEFVAINTDKQALGSSRAKKKIVIGEKLTKGFGAGADPVRGAQAAEESKDTIKALLKGIDMLFLTAGMGGGTGTGAMPVIASIARELGILTVAVVTKPFNFEGPVRMNNALQGIEKLKKYVDTLVVIPNEKLMDIMPKGAPLLGAFKVADDVLKNGIAGITNLITERLEINLDFADIITIMSGKGMAHMGVGEAEGDGKVIKAVRDAVASPLLETRIDGATGIIICFIGDQSVSLHEVNEATNLVRSIANPNVNLIFGLGFDGSTEFEGKVRVVLIATGFNQDEENGEGSVCEESQSTYVEETPVQSERRSAPASNNIISRYNVPDASDNGLDIVFPDESDYTAPVAPKTNDNQPKKSPNNGRIDVDDLPPFIRQLRNMGKGKN